MQELSSIMPLKKGTVKLFTLDLLSITVFARIIKEGQGIRKPPNGKIM